MNLRGICLLTSVLFSLSSRQGQAIKAPKSIHDIVNKAKLKVAKLKVDKLKVDKLKIGKLEPREETKLKLKQVGLTLAPVGLIGLSTTVSALLGYLDGSVFHHATAFPSTAPPVGPHFQDLANAPNFVPSHIDYVGNMVDRVEGIQLPHNNTLEVLPKELIQAKLTQPVSWSEPAFVAHFQDHAQAAIGRLVDADLTAEQAKTVFLAENKTHQNDLLSSYLGGGGADTFRKLEQVASSQDGSPGKLAPLVVHSLIAKGMSYAQVLATISDPDAIVRSLHWLDKSFSGMATATDNWYRYFEPYVKGIEHGPRPPGATPPVLPM